MINMGVQRPKTGGNWPLTGRYLQRCNKWTQSTIRLLLFIDVSNSIWYLKRSYWKSSSITSSGLSLKVDSQLGYLTVFKCYRVIFLLKKPFNFHFRLIFIFNKKEPQSCQFAAYRLNALLSFWCQKQEKWLFQFSNLSPLIYLLGICISLTY